MLLELFLFKIDVPDTSQNYGVPLNHVTFCLLSVQHSRSCVATTTTRGCYIIRIFIALDQVVVLAFVLSRAFFVMLCLSGLGLP